MIGPARSESFPNNDPRTTELIELATDVEELVVSRAKIGNPPIEDKTGTIYVSETENEVSHLHAVGKVSMEDGRETATEYIWDVVDPLFRRVRTTVRTSNTESGGKTYGVDIKEGFDEEDIGAIKKLLAKFSAGISKNDLLGAETATSDAWIDSELERGLTGDGLSVAEWIALQTYIMDQHEVKSRMFAQTILEIRLESLARGGDG